MDGASLQLGLHRETGWTLQASLLSGLKPTPPDLATPPMRDFHVKSWCAKTADHMLNDGSSDNL